MATGLDWGKEYERCVERVAEVHRVWALGASITGRL